MRWKFHRVSLLFGLLLIGIGCNPKGKSENELAVSAGPVSDSFSRSSRARSLNDIADRGVRVKLLGGRAFMVEDFGSPPPGSARDVVRELEGQAIGGDAHASYLIYLKINECMEVLSRKGTGQIAKARPEVVEGCDGLSSNEYARSSEWLKRAAAQGSLGAQLLYATNPEAILGDASEILRDPEAAIRYKEQAVHYLESAAAQGSVDALLRLGNAYRAGVLVNEDLSTSYAYYEAVRQISSDLIPAQRVKELSQQLNAAQLTEAITRGRKIYEDCCR